MRRARKNRFSFPWRISIFDADGIPPSAFVLTTVSLAEALPSFLGSNDALVLGLSGLAGVGIGIGGSFLLLSRDLSRLSAEDAKKGPSRGILREQPRRHEIPESLAYDRSFHHD